LFYSLLLPPATNTQKGRLECATIRMVVQMNDKFEGSGRGLIRVIFRYLLGGAEGNYENIILCPRRDSN
jgi:hypothetical protein